MAVRAGTWITGGSLKYTYRFALAQSWLLSSRKRFTATTLAGGHIFGSVFSSMEYQVWNGFNCEV